MEININLIILILIINLFFFRFNTFFADNLKLYDKPDFKRKIHRNSVPLTGGIYFFINFLLITLLFNLDYFENLNLGFENKREFVGFVFLVSGVFFLGLYDDRFDIKPYSKLFLLTIVILISILIDEDLIVTELNFNLNEININLYKLSIPLTILFFLLFLNAINMFDGIDMQVLIYFLIIILFLFLNFKLLYFVYFLPVVIISSYFNIKKKLFLGDSGTYVIGILISWLIIKKYNLNDIFNCEEIFLIMALPGFDMFRLFCVRIIKGKNPFKPDNNHIHHLLMTKMNYIKTFVFIQSLILIPFTFYYLSEKIVQSIVLLLILYVSSLIFIFFYKRFYNLIFFSNIFHLHLHLKYMERLKTYKVNKEMVYNIGIPRNLNKLFCLYFSRSFL